VSLFSAAIELVQQGSSWWSQIQVGEDGFTNSRRVGDIRGRGGRSRSYRCSRAASADGRRRL
jgi:hypothetical protein